jgi:hypothetical protein
MTISSVLTVMGSEVKPRRSSAMTLMQRACLAETQERSDRRIAWLEVEDRDLVGGLCEGECTVNVVRSAYQNQPALAVLDARRGLKDHVNAAALDEAQRAQVEYDAACVLLCLLQRLAELRRVREIQFASYMHPCCTRIALLPSANELWQITVTVRCLWS